MKIQCTNTNTFEFIDGSEKLGQINYDSLFSYKATATAGNNDYEIKPIGIFSTTISVTKNAAEIANMQMNWKGHIIISFQNGQEYIVKATGTFLNKFVVEDQEQQKLYCLILTLNGRNLAIIMMSHLTINHKTFCWYCWPLTPLIIIWL